MRCIGRRDVVLNNISKIGKEIPSDILKVNTLHAKQMPVGWEESQTKNNRYKEQEVKLLDMDKRNQIEKEINALFESLNTGLALKFHEKSGDWYAVVENKLTHEVVKEVPPKYILELRVKLKEMIGAFLDKKI